MYKVSIILPCYNVEKYVWSCLKSIENQTIGMENLQLIMINDGSEDNTLSYLQAFKEKYPNNVIIMNLVNNVGLSAARNIGMDMVESNFIAFVDSDDLLASSMIEKMYEEACKSNSDIVTCGFRAFRKEDECKEGENGEDSENGSKAEDLADVNVRKRYLIKLTGRITVWGNLYRTDFLKKNYLRFFEGHVYEDHHFTCMCILLADRVCVLDQKLYFYRMNEGGITHKTFSTDRNKDHFLVANHIFDNMKELGIYEECMEKYGQELKALYIWFAYFNPLSMARTAYHNEVNFFKQKLLELDPDCLSNPYVTSIIYPMFLEFLGFLK